jgi:hypothetical protein
MAAVNEKVRESEVVVGTEWEESDDDGVRVLIFLLTKSFLLCRNADKGNAVVAELHAINGGGRATFLQKDISLISNVDELCAEIRQREPKINCVFLTTGYMTLKGRDESAEGIDKRMAVNYYSRMRIVLNLMPCLDQAVQVGELARVITVLAAGSEKDILNPDDLELKHNFNLHECLAHCVIMSDFMVEELSQRHPDISFSHSFPGSVKSGIANQLTSAARLAVKVLFATTNSWLLDSRESGERHLFQMTSQCFKAANRNVGLAAPKGLGPMRGMNGELGSGGYLLDWDCKPSGEGETINKYRALGLGPRVWQHTADVFERALEKCRRDSKRPAGEEADGNGFRANPVGWRSGELQTNGSHKSKDPTGWRSGSFR